jgi:hypothetical protein
VREPSPASAAEGLSACSIVGLGDTRISTSTAYPTANASDPAQAGGRLSLYISAEAIADPNFGANDTACGGNFTLETYYCSTRVAVNVTAAAAGANSSLVAVNYTVIGDPSAPLCSECPAGTAFLTTDPASPLFGICSAACAGAATYIDIDAQTGLSTCLACHPSCATCVAKGGPRACTSCAAGAVLLPNFRSGKAAGPPPRASPRRAGLRRGRRRPRARAAASRSAPRATR